MAVSRLHGLLAPFLLLLLLVPAVVVAMLAVVAVMMTPALVAMVGKARFPALERKKGGGFAASDLLPSASALHHSYYALHEWLGIAWVRFSGV